MSVRRKSGSRDFREAGKWACYDTVNLAHWHTVCSNRVMGNLSKSENKESLIHGMPLLLRHIGSPPFLSVFCWEKEGRAVLAGLLPVLIKLIVSFLVGTQPARDWFRTEMWVNRIVCHALAPTHPCFTSRVEVPDSNGIQTVHPKTGLTNKCAVMAWSRPTHTGKLL